MDGGPLDAATCYPAALAATQHRQRLALHVAADLHAGPFL